MSTAKQVDVILYTLMGICHFILGALNTDNGLVLWSQIVGAMIWIYMAFNILNTEGKQND